ncbi:MAG: carboxy terminal-processing peptidase [Gammaproteobacteria bacterium]|jgi:carboxyl-terminal processing protease|nr:carboxy terminal-processing peptidase [Gammaproteobacteria bacterium]MDP6732328.1 carboxy terminal-processing peptidase [Gammaproteobacteria bacterium]
MFKFAVLTACACFAGSLLAQDEFSRLNTILDIDALYTPLESKEIHGDTAVSLLRELQTKHYSAVEIDDNFSSLVFDSYLDLLDGSHLYFLKEDIDNLSSFRYTIDDSLKDGSVEAGFDIYNLYHKRILERLIFAINRVENNIPEMDFTQDEFIDLDREEAPYAATVEDLDEIWRLRMKNSVLSLKLAGDSEEEIAEKLSERYRNQLNQILKTNDRDIFQAYLSTVAKAVDPHTAYFSPRDSENFNMGLSLSLEGIGAQLQTEEEYTKIVELIKGGPADRGDELQAGDRIIGIGQGVDGEIQDVVGMRLDDVVSQIRGEKGTVVRLNVIPVDALSETSATVVSITRDTVKLEDQSAKKEVIELTYNDDDYKIGIIDLSTFYFDFEAAARGEEDFKSSTRDVRMLLEELKEEAVDAVVVDLRNNGGGSLSEANQLVGLFIETGATVQIRYSGIRNGFTRSFGDNDPEVAYAGPLAVLVNRTSASASEIFAGAIQDYQRGIVLGGQTFGKGTVQEIIPMDYGQVKLTRSKFYRISGASTQHRGVVPDIQFPDFYDAYEDIGESSLDGALPWDTVRPVEYRAYHSIQTMLPELQALHEERVEASPDFIYLMDQIERTRELREREQLSLNELVVKAQREESRRAEFDAENMRRFLKGLSLREWVVESDEESSEEEPTSPDNDDVSVADNDAETDAVEEEEGDPLLLESGRILADFIALDQRRVSSVDDIQTDR